MSVAVGTGFSRAQGLIPALGIVQILSWGASYYLPAVLGRQIVEATGWSYAYVIGGMSVGLGVAGLSSVHVGRLIERHGGRPVLTVASLIMALGLVLVGLSPNVPCYLAAWAVMGVAMSAGLYDAAFSTIGRIYGPTARRAISTLTLWSGFASTVSWPLSALLVAHFGWRGTCFTYAFLELVVCIPLVRAFIPKLSSAPVNRTTAATTDAEVPPLGHRRITFVLLSAILTTGGLMYAVVSVHLITFLEASGASYAVAVGLGTLIGPAQVFCRLLERLFGAHLHPIWTMMSAMTMTTLGLSLLAIDTGWPAIALISYGAGAGIWTIARGTLPLALFGARGYPVLMGKLATPMLITQALAPSVGALLVDSFGVPITQRLLVATCVACLAGTVALLGLARTAVFQTS